MQMPGRHPKKFDFTGLQRGTGMSLYSLSPGMWGHLRIYGILLSPAVTCQV